MSWGDAASEGGSDFESHYHLPERPLAAPDVLPRPGEQDELERRRPGPSKLPCIGCGTSPSPCWYAEPPRDYPVCQECFRDVPEAGWDAIVAKHESKLAVRALVARGNAPPAPTWTPAERRALEDLGRSPRKSATPLWR